jgi:NAD(P)-dependent dehydrogenase (short-subunit alcohol dehydrogenase family)
VAQRVWMITGASRGFGAEMAEAVLASGDKVVATARNTKGLAYLQGTEGVDNPNIYGAALDVTDEAQVQNAVEAALKHFGQIDVLVNAGPFFHTERKLFSRNQPPREVAESDYAFKRLAWALFRLSVIGIVAQGRPSTSRIAPSNASISFTPILPIVPIRKQGSLVSFPG